MIITYFRENAAKRTQVDGCCATQNSWSGETQTDHPSSGYVVVVSDLPISWTPEALLLTL